MINHTNNLNVLNQIINETTNRIHNFTNLGHDFTRNRKLPAKTIIKTILNYLIPSLILMTKFLCRLLNNRKQN